MLSFRLSKQGWAVIIILSSVFFLYYFSNVNPIARLKGDVISVRTLLTQCVLLAENAGKVIKSKHASTKLNTRVKVVEGGPPNELVTDVDMVSHQVIVSGLHRKFKQLQIISEEHPTSPPVNDPQESLSVYPPLLYNRLPDNDLFVPIADLVVWVDPLDATQEFTEGLLECVSVMICVALHGHPIIGVIHQPFMNKTYWAWESYGISEDVIQALADAIKMHSQFSHPLGITYSRSHLNNDTMERLANALKPQEVRFLPAGGSGYKTLSLLNGHAQVYIHPSSTRRWDICAPHAILESVGGRMTGLDGSRFTFHASDPPQIPKSVGLFAASSISNHNQWRAKMAQVNWDT